MKVKISKSANKFLEKLESSYREAVLEKIGILKQSLEKQEVYPPEELDIKKLKGHLKGCFANALFVITFIVTSPHSWYDTQTLSREK